MTIQKYQIFFSTLKNSYKVPKSPHNTRMGASNYYCLFSRNVPNDPGVWLYHVTELVRFF